MSSRSPALGALALAGVVPVVLIAVQYIIPDPLHAALVFRAADPAPWTPLTSAYVHASPTHLWGNLLLYVVAVTYTYALAVAAAEPRWFGLALVGTLTLVPVLAHLTSWPLLVAVLGGTPPVSQGFSSVVGGMTGLLVVALGLFLGRRHGRTVAVWLTALLGLAALLVVDARYGSGPPVVELLVGAFAASVTVAYVHRVPDPIPHGERVRHVAGSGAVVAAVGLALSQLARVLFPAAGRIFADGVVINVFSHAAGVGHGVVIGVAAVGVDRLLG